jgi:microcin C transport system substrate-binding protein
MDFELNYNSVGILSRSLLVAGLVSLLVACGDSGSESADSGIDNTQEVLHFYAANPERFRFKTVADIPADLEWETGADLSEIGSPEAIKGGTWYEWIEDFPPTLRSIGPSSATSFRPWVLDNMGMMLAHRHPNDLDYYPGISEAWAISESDNTVYIKIDPDARWTDGEMITADDMMFTMYMGMSEHVNAPWQNNYWSNEFTHVTKFDDHTFAFGVPEIQPDTLAVVLEISPYSQKFFKELGPDFPERYQWRAMPTAGAYEIKPENVTMGSNIVLTKVEDWWAKDKKYWRYRFNPERINLSVIRESAKRFEAFRSGNLDMFEIRTSDIWHDLLADNDPDVQAGYIHKAQFYTDGPRSNWGLWMNSARPGLDNQDIRLGIQYASNWELVIEKYFRGDLFRLNTAREGFGEFSDPSIKARQFDVEKALEHFAKAGYTDRGPDGILLNAQGERLAFTLSTHYTRYADVFTILKEEAAKAGLELRIEMMDSVAGSRKVNEKQHEIYFISSSPALELFPRFWDYYHSVNAYDTAFLDDGSVNPDRKLKTQTNNRESVAILELDELIDRYDRSKDLNEMLQLSYQISQIHHDYASFSPGFVQPFYWNSSWRWVKWPEGYNAKYTQLPRDIMVHWIDTKAKEETLAARRSGQTFPPVIGIYDQYKVN